MKKTNKIPSVFGKRLRDCVYHLCSYDDERELSNILSSSGKSTVFLSVFNSEEPRFKHTKTQDKLHLVLTSGYLKKLMHLSCKGANADSPGYIYPILDVLRYMQECELNAVEFTFKYRSHYSGSVSGCYLSTRYQSDMWKQYCKKLYNQDYNEMDEDMYLSPDIAFAELNTL